MMNEMDKNSNRHEAIRAKQNAKPTEVFDAYWIFATRRKGKYPKATKRSGKWLIFVDPKDIDEVWANVKEGTEQGNLGSSAKVSTAKPNPLAGKSKQKVICVYTYDWMDEADVRRVREELRIIGITSKIPYKADEDTLSGKYRVAGDTKISKYYE